jgi:cell division septation protein DedD
VLTASNPDGAADIDWGGGTQVKSGGATTRVASATPPPSPISTGAVAPSATAPAKPLTGKFVLQIGAVRNRSDADALANRVRQEHGAALGGREPIVDEAVIGNFGSFHRVRVGPYADAKEPGKFCSTLIKAGYDCLVVTQ